MKERDGPNKVSYWVVDRHKHLTGESKRVTTTKQQKGEASMKVNIEVKSVVTATPGYPMWVVLGQWEHGDFLVTRVVFFRNYCNECDEMRNGCPDPDDPEACESVLYPDCGEWMPVVNLGRIRLVPICDESDFCILGYSDTPEIDFNNDYWSRKTGEFWHTKNEVDQCDHCWKKLKGSQPHCSLNLEKAPGMYGPKGCQS